MAQRAGDRNIRQVSLSRSLALASRQLPGLAKASELPAILPEDMSDLTAVLDSDGSRGPGWSDCRRILGR